MRAFTLPRLHTLLVVVIGAATFVTFGLPLPLLLGPMLGCLVAALAGRSLQGMGKLGIVMPTFLGVAIGSSITPALIRDLPHMGATLALVPLFVVTIRVIGYPFFRRGMGYDHPTAFYAAMPGGIAGHADFRRRSGRQCAHHVADP